MQILRNNKSKKEEKFNRERAKEGMAKIRVNQSDKNREYQRIKNKYKCKKKFILKYNSEVKESSKHGMKLLRKEGRLREEKKQI